MKVLDFDWYEVESIPRIEDSKRNKKFNALLNILLKKKPGTVLCKNFRDAQEARKEQRSLHKWFNKRNYNYKFLTRGSKLFIKVN